MHKSTGQLQVYSHKAFIRSPYRRRDRKYATENRGKQPRTYEDVPVGEAGLRN